MSKTKFKPMIIGTNTSIESEYKRNLDAKRSDLSDLKAYASRFVDVESYDILEKDFSQTFRKRFSDKFASQFPKLVNQSKQLEMVDCDISKIDSLSMAIQSNKIALDNELNPTEKTDFNIYTKDEKENQVYTTLQRLSEDYSTLKGLGYNIFPMAICNGTQQALMYDFSTQSLKPNISIFAPSWGRI